MTSLKELANAEIAEVVFKDDFGLSQGQIKRMLKSLDVGEWLAWDSDEFNRQSIHACARLQGMVVRTKKHNTIACYIVQRIK